MDATKICLYVFEVSTAADPFARRARHAERPERRDPFIAGLIRKLQDEVRAERAARRWDLPTTNARWAKPRAEAPPPLGRPSIEFDLPGDDWPLLQDPLRPDSDFDFDN